MSRLVRGLTLLTIAALTASTVSACGAPHIATCSEFAAMGDDTGLFGSMSDAQSKALQVSLDAAGYDDGAYNQGIGYTEVVAYCNIYDGVANSNQDQPISNAH